LPHTTEAPSSLRYETSPEAELTPNGIIFTPFVKQGLPIETFIKRRLNFLGLGGGRGEMGTHAPKEAKKE
jgi:hypothetical protein